MEGVYVKKSKINKPPPSKKVTYNFQPSQYRRSPIKNRNLFQTTQKILKETTSITPVKNKKRSESESFKKKTVCHEKL